MEAYRIGQPQQQKNDLPRKCHNRSQMLSLLPINRTAKRVPEDQTRRAEDPDDEEDVATALDEAGKGRMEIKMRKHNNICLVPCGHEALELV